uniref:Uncharacterized protein n=1 Tax=Rhizophora mucronata TaxID=61149 RepID=A0A2P2NIN3_RHIMU
MNPTFIPVLLSLPSQKPDKDWCKLGNYQAMLTYAGCNVGIPCQVFDL